MPNWCFNSVLVTGEKEELNRFKDHVSNKKSAFSLNEIIPMPDDIFRGDLGEKERKKYGEKNWYDWSWANWGTKWDTAGVEIESETDSIQYKFETAWNPPEPIAGALREEFPKLEIDWEWEEEGGEKGEL